MSRRTLRKQQKAAVEQRARAVSVYVNYNQWANESDYISPHTKDKAQDKSVICIYVDIRHDIATSYYLIPPTATAVHLQIDAQQPQSQVIEVVDSMLTRLRTLQSSHSGTVTINTNEFNNAACHLRLENGRILCISIDQWPDLLPPFLRNQANAVPAIR